jgi:TFIIF-interacting CTD phosphatase-like protein
MINSLTETKNKKLSVSGNFTKNSRGISVDNSKKLNKNQELMMSKLITQTNKSTEIQNIQNYQSVGGEKVHSQSPVKRINPEENYLIPPQTGKNIGMKTLILDLDETLIHSAFQQFTYGSDIVLKVI